MASLGGGSATLTNCTVSDNVGTSSSGGIYLSGTANSNNTIVAGNTDSSGASDIGGSGTVSGSNNLIGTGSGGLINGSQGNLVGVANPGLAPLGNDGGPTETMALLAGSVAIDAGSNALAVDPSGNPLTTDQRGFSRISGGTVDIGAFEVQKPILNPTTLPNGNYGTAYNQSITATETGGAGGPYTFAITAGTRPTGLTLSTGGVLSGVPTVAETVSFTVTATDSSGFAGSQTYTITVAPAPLTIMPSAGQSKVYGAVVPALSYTPSGFVNGDTSSLLTGALGTTATTASPVSGTYTFTLGTLSAGSNYSLAIAANAPTFAVTPAPLTVSGITASAKVYDATTSATLTGLDSAYLNGVIGADSVSLVTTGANGTFASKDVASNIVVLISGLSLGGAQASDYSLTPPTTIATITPAMLTVSGITAVNKVYDATIAATLNTSGATLVNKFPGDSVTLNTGSATGTFDSKDVGTGKPVAVSGLTIDGAQAFDYALVQPTTTANITQAMLTVSGITAENKVYDATTTATLLGLGTAILNGRQSGDAVDLITTEATGTFATKDVGTTISVAVSGLAINGAQAFDYALTPTTTTAKITAATLVASLTGTVQKTYDGTIIATLAPGDFTLSGVFAGDSVAPNDPISGIYDNKNVGMGKTVSVADLTLTGSAADDYQLSSNSISGAVGEIDSATLTITANNETKVYGAALPSPLTFTLSGFVDGDNAKVVSGNPDLSTTVTASSVVGSYPITVADAGTLNAANYDFPAGNFVNGTLAVTQASPSIIWASPGEITFGTALSNRQLDASANVLGSFTYTPDAGTYLNAGSGQSLSATFTPQDLADYTTAAATTAITVDKATPTLKLSDPGGAFDGRPFPASVTIAGAGKDNAPAASLTGVNPTLTYYDGSGTSGSSLGSKPPSAAGIYTVVAAFAGTADYIAVESTPVTFTIEPGHPRSRWPRRPARPSTARRSRSSRRCRAPITASGTVTFLDGGTTLATVPLDGSGTATLNTAGLALGPHSITATYSGDAALHGAQSGSASESVAPAGTVVVLVPHPLLKRKKVVSELLTAEIKPTYPGGGVPTGMVTFELLTKNKRKTKTKTLGTVAASGGNATLTVKSNLVLSKVITIIYSGDTDFITSTLTAPKLSKKGL